jgi:hypothetical protein
MVLPNEGQRKRVVEVGRSGQLIAAGRSRLTRELFSGRYPLPEETRRAASPYLSLATSLMFSELIEISFS